MISCMAPRCCMWTVAVSCYAGFSQLCRGYITWPQAVRKLSFLTHKAASLAMTVWINAFREKMDWKQLWQFQIFPFQTTLPFVSCVFYPYKYSCGDSANTPVISCRKLQTNKLNGKCTKLQMTALWDVWKQFLNAARCCSVPVILAGSSTLKVVKWDRCWGLKRPPVGYWEW